jgi:hypothetical protein
MSWRPIVLIALTLLVASRSIWLAATRLQERLPLRVDARSVGDMPTLFEPSFAAFGKILEPQAKVGYVSTNDNMSDIRWKLLAQYALVPRVVSHDSQQQLLIGNFSDNASMNAFLRGKPAKILAVVGPGLALIQNLSVTQTSPGVPLE